MIEPLIQTRVLKASAEHVEFAHQTLFQQWPELKDWVKENKYDFATKTFLVADARRWLAGGKKREDLELNRLAVEKFEALSKDLPSIFGDSLIKDYLTASKIELLREKLIVSVKGGHITGALQTLMQLQTLDRKLTASKTLTVNDRGWYGKAKPHELWASHYAALTGDDRSDAEILRNLGVGAQGSLFDDEDERTRTSSRGMTALHWAAAFGNHELIKRIVAKGGNPAILMEDGSNAVHNAAYGGHLVICAIWLKSTE